MSPAKATGEHGYIDAIDGLRAVAVLLVLVFHAGFSWLGGGYVGVDVFFVISGFLITRNILDEIDRGSWSFWEFYGRRIARLFPALFVTILLSLAAAIFILSAADLQAFARATAAAAMSVSNILFWTEAGYFERAGETKALLHTWSLGVEEQFYLVWPVILVLLCQAGRHAVAAGLLVLGVLSLAAAWHFQPAYPSAVFFLTPFRVFQFAAGGLVALLVVTKASAWRDVLSVCGIAALIMVASLSDRTNDNILVTMLAPAIAAALFILGARAPLTERVFASAPMKWIGRASYSIYLVHWPLFVFWRMSTDYVLSPLEGVVAIVLAIAIGAALQQLVEKPFRIGKATGRARQRLSLAVSGGGLSACVVFAGVLLVNVPDHSPDARNASLDRFEQAGRSVAGPVSEEDSSADDLRCFMRSQDRPEQYGIDLCARPDKGFDGKLNFLVAGDSYAGDSFITLRNAYPEAYFGYFVVPGCPFPEIKAVGSSTRNGCVEHYRHLIDSVLPSLDVDGVFLVSDWKNVSDDTLDGWIELLRTKGHKVGIVGGRPIFRDRVPLIIERFDEQENALRKANELIVEESRERNVELMASMDEAGVPYADLYAAACPERCEIFDDNEVEIYKDERHLSVRGSVWLGRQLGERQPDLLDELTKP